jgi:hypothetical protein
MKYCFFLCLLLLFSCAENEGDFKNTSNLPDLTEHTTAQYAVTFTSNWTIINFQTDYPMFPTFSNMLLMTHNNKVQLFVVGEIASAGISQMAVDGITTLLEAELNGYKTGLNAEWHNFGVQNVSMVNNPVNITIGSKQPMVSFCMNLNPSPNWFIGAVNQSLLNNDGTWKPTLEISLSAYDNDGTTTPTTTYNSSYVANSIGVITAISPTALSPNAAGMAIGKVTFTKL